MKHRIHINNWLTLAGFFLLLLATEVRAQDFQPISVTKGKNYIIGVGLGDAQLNTYTDYGKFGRSTYAPRLTVEFGQYRKIDPLFGLLLSARLSYQQLRLHPVQSEEDYNDVISFSDLQLRYGFYLGKDLIKLHAGGSIRAPLTSSFKVKSVNGNGTEEYYDLSDEVRVGKVSLATELGITFLFNSFHIGTSFSWSLREFVDSSFSNGPYLFEEVEYLTLEIVIYKQLKL